MPVEQAFTLLVQVNNHYGLRELFLSDFDGLHLRLYQLKRIVQDQLPDVAKHFEDLGLETHMYANQWFLALFTAKFPLSVVFHIVDLFLAEVTSSKMIKFAKEWMAIQTQEKLSESPVQALERQVAELRERVNQLERENEALASGLISSKTSMHREVDKLEDKAEILTRELFVSRQDLQDTLEEKRHLETEVTQVKKMLRDTLNQVTQERMHQQTLVAAYRAVASDLSRSRSCQLCNSGPEGVNGSPANLDADHTRASSPDAVALHLRLLWSLIEQVHRFDQCGPVLTATVQEWRKSVLEETDTARRDSMVETLVEEYLKDNPTQSWIDTKDTGVQMITVGSPDSPHQRQPIRRESEPTVVSVATTKSKQWLTNTINSLRSIGSLDVTTGTFPTNTANQILSEQSKLAPLPTVPMK
ncbi:Rab GTPase-activating protein 1 [Fasciola hepatica]|uniref:Rab GTPase-activating protein 1 n=1 Tax=Fasciola hepatica TaxID=6192 RepID=A0A4E0R6W2_FASHE|nr:Rab GTPase-activating protein 1 [Fasciola hepatica]